MSILFFAGALRKDSLNKKFARAAEKIAREAGAGTEFVDLKDYPMPPYDGDIEASSGVPETTRKLAEKIKAADALVISTPEYNGSIPGMLKNVIDWLSRDKPVSLTGKHLLLLAASPGALGGVRSLWQSRPPFEMLGMHVYPSMLGLPGADKAFSEDGSLTDEKIKKQLTDLMGKYLEHVKGKA